MRRITLLSALFLAVGALALPAGALAQAEHGVVPGEPGLGGCITCSASNVNGTWKCTMSLAQVGWDSCKCNPLCDCSGDCVTTESGVALTDRALKGADLAELGRIPVSGARLRQAPTPVVLASLNRGRWMGRLLESVYVGDNYGLVQRSDGSWNIFRLEADGTLVLRDCAGLFRGLVHRALPGDARTAPALAVASL